MTVITKPLNPSEQDLLLGHETETLLVCTLDGKLVKSLPAPAAGWSHESLDAEERSLFSIPDLEAWDLFLGSATHWIGSSEV